MKKEHEDSTCDNFPCLEQMCVPSAASLYEELQHEKTLDGEIVVGVLKVLHQQVTVGLGLPQQLLLVVRRPADHEDMVAGEEPGAKAPVGGGGVDGDQDVGRWRLRCWKGFCTSLHHVYHMRSYIGTASQYPLELSDAPLRCPVPA